MENTDVPRLAAYENMLQLLVLQSAVATLHTGVIMIGTLLNLINVQEEGFSLCCNYFQMQGCLIINRNKTLRQVKMRENLHSCKNVTILSVVNFHSRLDRNNTNIIYFTDIIQFTR